MKSKTMFVMVVAVVGGLGAAYFTNKILAKPATVKVLVAKHPYTPPIYLKNPATMFEEQEWPEEKQKAEAPNYVKNIMELNNRVLKEKLEQGQAILESHVGAEKSGLEEFLKPDHVALALPASATNTVAGFVLPNSYVDIIHTTKKNDRIETKVLLENVHVLAVDSTPERQTENTGKVPQTVTVEVKPDEALILNSAMEGGTLRLTLRPAEDHKKGATGRTGLAYISGPPVEKEKEKPQPPPPVATDADKKAAADKAGPPAPKKVDQMVIYNSSDRTSVTFTEHHDGQVVTSVSKGAREQEARPAAAPLPARSGTAEREPAPGTTPKKGAP